MKVYLTGGTGYISARLIAKLLDTGHEVMALYRAKKPSFERQGLHWVFGDLQQVESLRSGMQGCEQVYHLAALARLWHADMTAFYTMNVKGTENILRAAMDAGVQKMVFTSTAAIFNYSLNRMVSESDPFPETFEDEYARTKFLAEQKVIEAVQKGFHAVMVHPSRVYGPGDPVPAKGPASAYHCACQILDATYSGIANLKLEAFGLLLGLSQKSGPASPQLATSKF